MGDRGSVSIYWVIVILIVIELIFFALNMGSKNLALSSSKHNFLEEAIYVENLSEQAKYFAYKLVEDASIQAKSHTEYMIDLLEGEVSDEEIGAIYDRRLETYLDRLIKLENTSGHMGSGSREELRLRGYPEEYELGSLPVKVKVLSRVELGPRTRRYKLIYEYYEPDGGVGYLSSPVFVELSYPGYDDLAFKDSREVVRVYTASNYEWVN